MSDDKDQQTAQRGQAPKPSGGIWPVVGVIAVIGVAGFLFMAWSHGKDLAQRDEAIGYACGAAAASPHERAACVEAMDADYRGDLTPERTGNAAAEAVRRARE